MAKRDGTGDGRRMLGRMTRKGRMGTDAPTRAARQDGDGRDRGHLGPVRYGRSVAVLRGAALAARASGTFSTLVASAGARQIGRSARFDWMLVGTVLTRDRGVVAKPGPKEIVSGIVVHQAADLAWSMVFWAALREKDRKTQRKILLAAGVPWAVATTAAEHWLILPWLRPMVKDQVPFRTAALVRLTSLLAYPIYLVIDRAEEPDDAARDKRLAVASLVLQGLLLGSVVTARLLDHTGHSPRPRGPPGKQYAYRRHLTHMVAHHEVGVALARLVATRGDQEELRTLGRLMWGEQETRLEIMRSWYRSWYGDDVPEVPPEEHRTMPGMPPEGELERLDGLTGRDLDLACLPVLIRHHEGAIRMSEQVRTVGKDPRIAGLARAVAYARQNQVETLRRLLRTARPVEEQAVRIRVTERIHGAHGPDVPRRRPLGRLLDATRRLPVLRALGGRGLGRIDPADGTVRPERGAATGERGPATAPPPAPGDGPAPPPRRGRTDPGARRSRSGTRGPRRDRFVPTQTPRARPDGARLAEGVDRLAATVLHLARRRNGTPQKGRAAQKGSTRPTKPK